MTTPCSKCKYNNTPYCTDCMDLTRTMRVRSDTKMADIDDELRRTWLPKGYTWDGGVRNGIAGDSPFRNRTVTYTLRKK